MRADSTGLVRAVLRSAWPSFLVAGVAEMMFFTGVDPDELVGLRHGLDLSETAIHTLGFFFFWAIGTMASALSLWLAATPLSAKTRD